MSMDSVLKRLESRIEELVTAYRQSTERVSALEAQVAELEERAAADDGLAQRATELEAQREKLAERLESVLGVIDDALRGVGEHAGNGSAD